MKINYQVNNEADVDGTSLKGYVETDYATLVKVFGEPSKAPYGDGKVQAEWVVFVEDILYTIYDYKAEKHAKYVTDWHIGGRHGSAKLAEYLVGEVINQNK